MVINMKKIINILLLLVLVLLISGCSNNILKSIELENNSCKIIKEKDTHGGFNGDGDYFALIKCSNIDYKKLSNNWHELPISDTLKKVLEIERCDDKNCKNIYDRYSIPKLKKGYYYFIDRHPEAKDIYSEKEVDNRASYNFTIAILDPIKDNIYYYELDT